MNLEQAKNLALPELNKEENVSVIVTSDNAVYINSNPLNVQKHAFRNKLKCFVLKGEEFSQEEVEKAIIEQNKSAIKEIEVSQQSSSKESVKQEVLSIIERADKSVSNNDLVRARNLYIQALAIDKSNEDAKKKLDWCVAELKEAAHIESELASVEETIENTEEDETANKKKSVKKKK
jgi:hypothetical protein